MLAVGGFEHAHGAGHAHRATAQHRRVEGQRLAVFAHELRGAGRSRGGFASIKGLHPLTVKVHQESAAADTTGLRLHQPQHQLYCNGGVQRRAACAEDLQPGVRGQRIGCSHRLAGVRPAGFVGQAAGGFRLLGCAVAPGGGGRLGAARRKSNREQKVNAHGCELSNFHTSALCRNCLRPHQEQTVVFRSY